MSLRKPPIQTPAFLSAHRLNARKCTGPRSVAGKARSSLNALKHGRFAHGLFEKLQQSRQFEEAALYASILLTFKSTFGIESARDWKQAERFSNGAYAMARQARVFKTKLECPLFSARSGPRVMPLFRFRVVAPKRRVGLAFWVQRSGFWNMERLADAMFHPCGTAEPPPGRVLESGVRHRTYRMSRPGPWERTAYGLNERGHADPMLKPQPALQRLLNHFDWGLREVSGQ